MCPSLRRRSWLLVLSEMEAGRRGGDLSAAALSLLYGPLHHRANAVNLSSNWHATADMWFPSSDFTTIFSGGDGHIVARVALIADLGSAAKFREGRGAIGNVSGVAETYKRRTRTWGFLDVLVMFLLASPPRRSDRVLFQARFLLLSVAFCSE